jgi:hypothetical protein
VPARYEAGEIVLSVAAGVVEASRYPAVLDPVMSAEVAIDEPPQLPSGRAQRAAIATAKAGALVVWETLSGIRGARFDATGTRLDANELGISAFGDHVSVASDGTDFVVLWNDQRNPNKYALAGVRVTAAGPVIDQLTFPTSVNSQSAPTVAWNGSLYLVTWTDNSQVLGLRLSASGAALDPSPLVIASLAQYGGQMSRVSTNG